MKNFILYISIFAFAFSCNTEPEIPADTYLINVEAKGVYNGIRAYIVNFDERRRQITIDTAMVINEKFSFMGNSNIPSIRYLTVDGVKNNLPFILEEGILNIELNKDNIENSLKTGTENNELFQDYLNELKTKSSGIQSLRNELNTASRENLTTKIDSLKLVYKEVTKDIYFFHHEFINKHKDSDFSLVLLESKMRDNKFDLNKVKENFESLKPIIEKSNDNKYIAGLIETFIKKNEASKAFDIGQIAPDFSAPTPDGDIIKLSDIKGKVTLIDFWASWCKPCRIENPNVVKVYEKYHDKGLEIISVSLDKPDKKDAWIKAIEDDNLQWHHVSNLKYWNDPVAQMYQVRSIPATFLLDAEGKIIAKKLRGAALENKIAELLDK